MLKDFHQDNVSSVFESVFHAGHFYRAIQCQDVREIRGRGRGLQCQESDRVTVPACCFSACAPATTLVTGCEVFEEWPGVSVCPRQTHLSLPFFRVSYPGLQAKPVSV